MSRSGRATSVDLPSPPTSTRRTRLSPSPEGSLVRRLRAFRVGQLSERNVEVATARHSFPASRNTLSSGPLPEPSVRTVANTVPSPAVLTDPENPAGEVGGKGAIASGSRTSRQVVPEASRMKLDPDAGEQPLRGSTAGRDSPSGHRAPSATNDPFGPVVALRTTTGPSDFGASTFRTLPVATSTTAALVATTAPSFVASRPPATRRLSPDRASTGGALASESLASSAGPTAEASSASVTTFLVDEHPTSAPPTIRASVRTRRE